MTTISNLNGVSLQTLLVFLRAAKSALWKEFSVCPEGRFLVGVS